MCFINLVKKSIIIFRISFGSKILGILVYVQKKPIYIYIYIYIIYTCSNTFFHHSNGFKLHKVHEFAGFAVDYIYIHQSDQDAIQGVIGQTNIYNL